MRVFLFIIIMSGTLVQAAIPPLQASLKKTGQYILNGSLIGGLAQRDLVLIGVRRTFSAPKKLERLILDVEGARSKIDRFGYFQIQMDPKGNRVVIDLNGVAAAQLPLENLALIIKKSPFVSDASITMDPEDRSANITVFLKGSVKYRVEAFELPTIKNLNKQTARLAIDINAIGN